MDITQATRRTTNPTPAEPQITLLADSYSPVILDGQILAVPLRPTTTDEIYVPALIDGQVAAVPVHNPLATPAVQPAAAPAAAAVADPGLPLAVRQSVLLGSVGAVSAGALVLMAGAGLGLAAAHADKIGEVLMWVTITVTAVAVGTALLLGKLRVFTRGSTAGASATANGDGSTAANTILAWSYRPEHRTTNIGRQTAWGRGGITNHTG
ncbi:hypothetical protein [Streptomyces sp. NRRL B-24484]|uniref:hypothetical protein n=1 Tax=Streptomyces sp. NRRL B-24484 TaxID=1463833 RepID=UPI0004C0A772|nr:hypothetical protein [Streptomyces sp. NRRL B-24484]